MSTEERSLCILHGDNGAFLAKRVFYKSDSPLFKTGVMPFCKDCMNKYINYDADGEELNVEQKQKRFIELCRISDTYFSLELYERSIEQDNFLGSYFRDLALRQYKDLRYSDYDELPIPEEYQSLEHFKGIEISNDQKFMWGEGHDPREYKFLDDRYNELVNKYIDSYGKEPTSEAKYKMKSVALIRLRVQNTLMGLGEMSMTDVTRLQKNEDEILSTIGMTYEQILEREDTGEDTLGKLIEEIEKDEPIPDWKNDFGYSDGLEQVIDVLAYQLARNVNADVHMNDNVRDFFKEYSVKGDGNE